MNAVQVKVSAANLRQLFHPCTPEFIRDVCHAHCCESSTSSTGTMIAVGADEQPRLEAMGATVVDGLIQPQAGCRKCPFKDAANLCTLHATDAKPWGCIASPFTLNKHGTLIVRNRYRVLRCFKAPGSVPAYLAHAASLRLIFGSTEAARITAHLDAGGADTMATMPADSYARLQANTATHTRANL